MRRDTGAEVAVRHRDGRVAGGEAFDEPVGAHVYDARGLHAVARAARRRRQIGGE